ncbi:MAG TPA: DUF4249 domain-containing protein [Ginsengibacter sp.]|nr:DUF4249 domain-containing protein [Ginsengibacter sp.]HRP16856.1 DUF4249 domain-containing protein [Ginsengibacter sp.]HRP45440.1 DUF4249 domain-containing protein [Ginsengibacter sp.]
MKTIRYSLYCIILVLTWASCKDPYNPILNPENKDVLVVEGYIDGADQTAINLSKVRIASQLDTARPEPVNNATVIVEDDNGGNYPLTGVGNGKYTGNYSYDPALKFRVRIRVISPQGNKEYVSDFVTYKVSPEIDSISYRVTGEGAQIFVNTHDPNNKTTFYHWKWNDTWEFHSTFASEYRYDFDLAKVVERTDDIYTCWRSDFSKEILISSTGKLSKDEIREFKINSIPHGDFRLSVLYSIQVQQYALDTAGFNFLAALKKNTENMGSLFDPQPSNIRGNIHDVNDPDALVVGYIGAGASYKTRKFIKIPWDYRQECPMPYVVPNKKDSIAYYFGSQGYIPLSPEMSGLEITGWNSAINYCTDCTLRGTNVKPSFWP